MGLLSNAKLFYLSSFHCSKKYIFLHLRHVQTARYTEIYSTPLLSLAVVSLRHSTDDLLPCVVPSLGVPVRLVTTRYAAAGATDYCRYRLMQRSLCSEGLCHVGELDISSKMQYNSL